MSDAPYGAAAKVYDLLYEATGKDFEAEAEQLHTLLQERRPGAGSLLDVACGTGKHLAHLAGRYEVAGVDASPAMLAIARGRLPGHTLLEGDLRTFSLGRTFDAVVCLFSSIGYLPSQAALDQGLRSLAAHLAPGGVLVVDGWIRPDAWIEPGITKALAANGDGVAVSRVDVSSRDGDRSLLELHHLIGSLDGVEHVVERHELTLFTDAAYRAAFAQAGLSVDVVPGLFPERDRYVGTLPA